MFRQLLCFFLVVHALGDFYAQSEKLADRKVKRYGAVTLHAAIYLAVSLACALFFWSAPILIATAALSVLHFAVDSVKFGWVRKARPDAQSDAVVFAVDQIVHLICIVAAALTLTLLDAPLKLLPGIETLLLRITETPLALLAWVGLVLLALKPANVTVKRLTARYRPEDDGKDVRNAGAWIGSLERLLILLLMSVGQYAAIGLVLTAKSVARYNKIAENKQFAEYYLLGTLLSALFAVGSYLLLI
jgi:hypothetical protein